MRKILEKCPTCDGDMVIRHLACSQCNTEVTGTFRPTIFARLTDENLRFVEIFVKNKGNIKEMERELDVSYWTIRNRLNDVIAEIGFATESPGAVLVDPAALTEQRKSILAQLEAGTLDVNGAAALLARLGG